MNQLAVTFSKLATSRKCTGNQLELEICSMDMTRGQKQKEAGLSFPCNGHQPACRSDIESAVLQGLVITLSTTNLRMTHVFASSDQQYAAPNVC